MRGRSGCPKPSPCWTWWNADACSASSAATTATSPRLLTPAIGWCFSAVLGCPPGEVSLGRDTLGCPRLADDRVRTSLSHADGLVAIAVSCVGRVGIDIEPVARAGAMAEIATRVCHPRELVALSRLSGPERTRALLSLWVCKEALLKAAGIGLAVDMEQFEAPVDRTLPLPGGVPGTAIVRLFDGDDRFLAALAGPPGGITSAWLPPPT